LSTNEFYSWNKVANLAAAAAAASNIPDCFKLVLTVSKSLTLLVSCFISSINLSTECFALSVVGCLPCCAFVAPSRSFNFFLNLSAASSKASLALRRASSSSGCPGTGEALILFNSSSIFCAALAASLSLPLSIACLSSSKNFY